MAPGDDQPALFVQYHDHSAVVPLGSVLDFGRQPDRGDNPVLVIGPDDPTVSRIHGRLQAHHNRWEAMSTGSYVGLLVHDLESTAMLDVPVGVGPVGIGFRSALVTIPTRTRYVIRVDADYLRSHTRDDAVPMPKALQPSLATEQVVPESACFDHRGRPLRWFQVLVALCEPRLRGPVGPLTLPSDTEIRQRLSMGSSAFDRAFARAREELGFEPYTNMVRLAMATIAVQQGVVRPEHLDLLNSPSPPP